MKELFSATYTMGWNKQVFSSPVLSLDTETVLIESKNKSPKMVLATVSDGETTIVLRPHEIDSFLAAHTSHIFVFHNASFDFWVLEEHTHRVWNLVESNRMHDTMYLDMLVRLANGLGESRVGSSEGLMLPKNLGMLATEYAKEIKLSFAIDKKSDYRLRFGELLLIDDWSKADKGFFEYAAGDTIATKRIYDHLYPKALALSKAFGISDKLINEYGPLTHHLQVKASIALLKMTRNGIGFNPDKVVELEASIRSSIVEDINSIESSHPLLFQKVKRATGITYKYSLKSNLPSVSTKYLRQELKNICARNGVLPPLSDGKTEGLISISGSAWEPYRHLDPLIDKYLNLSGTSRLLSFFKTFENMLVPRIHPSYQTLVRTGRTSSFGPNIQQMPGDKRFRSLFVPRKGKKYAVIDYAYIELRTLAVICEKRFGKSVLADTIRQGIDPHVYTAAMIRGQSVEDFKALKETDPETFKASRQSAKALNFGIPGGLGAQSLADYAQASYGVNLTKEQAGNFRKRLIYVIYPEIGKYLADNILDDLCKNLKISREMVEGPLHKIGPVASSAAIILSNTVKIKNKSEYKYSEQLWNTAWSVMRELLALSNHDFSHLKENADLQIGNMDFHYQLFATTATSLTGRVRGYCTYTQARNTPFQGLAADGAKRALWKLIKEKFYPVAFVHDEVVLEVDSPEEANKAKQIMEQEMFEAVDRAIPIDCSLSICDYWEK